MPRTDFQEDYRDCRNTNLKKAIKSIRQAEECARKSIEHSNDEDKLFCEGYEQALSEACINSINFWINVP